ncbi:dTDP-4-dehydrorhamnose 3,5-epimerase family protein [Dermacoccus nishinomiyaensis]|uniref:dTDP-4-dehydrorhamnose 3,5-epimerase family protein n=1 Tax=Dermacoccus nishinomiyaensis TaxID=1274 RepID=UPI0035CD39E6
MTSDEMGDGRRAPGSSGLSWNGFEKDMFPATSGRWEGRWRPWPSSRLLDRSTIGSKLAEHLGYEMRVVQTKISISSRGAVRGIHFADVPPAQAKYVTAVSGAFLDFVVDIGSP